MSALLSLTREDLVRAWSCGKKTIAEIEHLQARLRETSETLVTEEIRVRLSFHESTNEVFDAVRSILSVRGANVLEILRVDSLEKLMAVTKEKLLDCRNCGRKTAAEILRLQAEIGDFARHVAQESGEFRSEILLSAPCLAAPSARHERRSIEEHMLADAENPAPWLVTWVHGLARSERQARAFMLRKGMLGLAPMTLDRVGEQVGNVTRERARQMDKAVEKRAAVPLQQQRLRPLIDAAAAVVKERGGLISLEELTEAILCRGEDGDQLRFATKLIAFFSKFKVWKNAGLRVQRDGTVRNGDTRLLVRRLAGLVQKVAAAAADERHGDDLWSIERKHLKQTLRETYAAEFGDPPLATVSDAMLDALLKKRRQSLRSRGNRVYSLALWQLRFGNVLQMVDTVLQRMGSPAHFTEISKEAAKWRPGLSANNIHGTLDRSKNALLWDRGTFVHQDNVVIPLSLIHDVERWLLRALREDVPFVSVNGAFLHFHSRCERAGFPSEVALYTCLRCSAHPELVYPRLPCVYRKQGFTERIPTVLAFEDFLRDAGGPVSQQELKDFGLKKLFLKDYQYSQLSQRVSNVMRTADWGYVHLDNYDLDHEALDALVRYTQEVLAMEGHCSVDKIYREKRVTCKSAGINGPVMLYSAFQCFADDAFALNGYPHVVRWDRKKKKQRDTIRQRIIDFVRDSGKPCPYDLLEKQFVQKLGYKEQQIYSVAREPDVCVYHPGCVIHLRSLAWDESKQQALEGLAGRVYADALRAGRSFGHVSHLLESDDLPDLPPSMHWSRLLIADLLTKGGRYVMLGNRREAFVPRENKHGIQNFEDLMCVLLNEDWGGATNLTAFESALMQAGVIKSRVTAVMLGTGEKVVIENGEIIVKELLVDAQRP